MLQQILQICLKRDGRRHYSERVLFLVGVQRGGHARGQKGEKREKEIIGEKYIQNIQKVQNMNYGIQNEILRFLKFLFVRKCSKIITKIRMRFGVLGLFCTIN